MLDVLRCPRTKCLLLLKSVEERQRAEILAGELMTTDHFGTVYPILKGVPDFTESADTTEKVQLLSSFGTEWPRFDDWGWIDQTPTEPDAALRYFGGLLGHSQSAFHSKTQLRPEDCDKDQLVLDAGCGNSRFSNQAQLRGARVIAMDASAAAHVAFNNFQQRGIGTVGVVRGDMLCMPLADGTFDYGFSIGVMRHTGEPGRSLGELSRSVRAGGTFSVNCYGKGLPSFEFIDPALRLVTTWLRRRDMVRFANLLVAGDRFLRRGGGLPSRLEKFVRKHMCILPTPHHMYDWYALKLADHYTPEQLNDWIANLGAEVLAASPPFHEPGYEDSQRRRNHGSFQCLLKKPSVSDTGAGA